MIDLKTLNNPAAIGEALRALAFGFDPMGRLAAMEPARGFERVREGLPIFEMMLMKMSAQDAEPENARKELLASGFKAWTNNDVHAAVGYNDDIELLICGHDIWAYSPDVTDARNWRILPEEAERIAEYGAKPDEGMMADPRYGATNRLVFAFSELARTYNIDARAKACRMAGELTSLAALAGGDPHPDHLAVYAEMARATAEKCLTGRTHAPEAALRALNLLRPVMQG